MFLSWCVLVMMMNYFCGMVDQQNALSIFFSQDHYQKFSPSQISDTSRSEFEPSQSLSSNLSVLDSKLISNLWTVSSRTHLLINGTMDQLPVSNFNVRPKGKYFSGICFPPERAYTPSALLEWIRSDFYDDGQAEKALPVFKTSKKFCSNSRGSISPLIML